MNVSFSILILLLLYNQLFFVKKGMGIVESVGSNVKNIKVGDRVVVSAPIACGQCECK
jgi:threonine dehydrogenase-like Zn-dependent dehydrogenase